MPREAIKLAAASRAATSQPNPVRQRWLPGANRWLLLPILLVAVYLRESHMELLQWGGDPVVTAGLALRFTEHGEIPQVGDVTSVGVHISPLSYYMAMPFYLGTRDPTFFAHWLGLLSAGAVLLCYLIGRRFFNERVGLIAAALFATAPWAVLLSIAISGRGFNPILATVLLWAWYQVLLAGKRGYLGAVVLLSLAAAQVHLGASALIVLLGVSWLVLRFPLSWKSMALGVVLAMIPMVPYFSYQIDHHWEDFRQAATVVGASQGPALFSFHGLHPQAGFPLPSRDHLSYILNLASGKQIEDYLGLSTPEFHAGPGMSVLTALLTLDRWVIMLLLLGVAVYLVRSAKAAERFPFFEWRAHADLALLFLWLIVPAAFFYVVGLQTYLHYFSTTLPAAFLLEAWAFDRGATFLRTHGPPQIRRAAVSILWLALVGILLGQSAYLVKFQDFLARKGGVQGTHGVPYGQQLALAETIVENTNISPPLVAKDWPPRTPVEIGIQYLVWWKLGEKSLPNTLPAGQAHTAFVVVNTTWNTNEVPPALVSQPFRAFGKLRLYTVSYQPSS